MVSNKPKKNQLLNLNINPLLENMNKPKDLNSWLKGIAITIGILIMISLIIFFFAKQPFLESLRIVFGSVYVLFLPGFIISYIFFPKTKPFEENEEEGNNEKKDKIEEENEKQEKGAIDWIERIALSFALSIAIVPLCVFYLNLIGVKINLLNSFFTILGIITVSSLILYIRHNKK
jgi:uncharacterized membrane protein